MNMTVVSIAEYVALAVGLGAGIMLGIEKLKEKRRGLPPNPTRCADNLKRIEKLEEHYITCSGAIERLEAGVTGLNGKVDLLLDIHLKP